MSRVNTAVMFNKVVSKMLRERKKHVVVINKASSKISEIDRLFTRYGFDLAGTSGKLQAGKQALAMLAGGAPRKRKTFPVNAEQWILALTKKHGTPSTADINKHWKLSGRGGKADNTITKLVKAGKLKRIKSNDVRGSRYALA